MKSKLINLLVFCAVPLLLLGASQYTAVTQLWVTGAAYPSTFRNTGSIVSVNSSSTNFITVHASGTSGGFAWYDILTGGALGSPVATMDSSGNFRAASVFGDTVSGPSITGTNIAASNNLSAPSITATNVNATNSLSSYNVIGTYLTGNLLGSTWQENASCTTGPSQGNTCSETVSWRTSFANTGYVAVCTIQSNSANQTSGFPIVANTNKISGAQIIVTIANLTGGGVAGGGLLDCLATQN